MTIVIVVAVIVGLVGGGYAHAYRSDPYVRNRKLHRHNQRRRHREIRRGERHPR